MTDILIIAAVGAMVFFALRFIRREKRRGVQCVGCPDGGTCGGNCCGCK